MTWRTSFKEDLHRMNLTWHGARRAACCQRSTPVEKSRRPMSRPGQDELSLSAPLLLLPLSRLHHFNFLPVGKKQSLCPLAHVGGTREKWGAHQIFFGRRFAPALCPPLANCFRRCSGVCPLHVYVLCLYIHTHTWFITPDGRKTYNKADKNTQLNIRKNIIPKRTKKYTKLV